MFDVNPHLRKAKAAHLQAARSPRLLVGGSYELHFGHVPPNLRERKQRPRREGNPLRQERRTLPRLPLPAIASSHAPRAHPAAMDVWLCATLSAFCTAALRGG